MERRDGLKDYFGVFRGEANHRSSMPQVVQPAIDTLIQNGDWGSQLTLDNDEVVFAYRPQAPEAPSHRSPTLGDVFAVHERFERSRPQAKHITLWYQERLGHELEEWNAESPDSPEWLDEASDILLFWVGALRSAGVSPAVALEAAIEKMKVNEVRFPVDLFDGSNGKTYQENYEEAKRREGKPITTERVIYHSSFMEDTEYDGEP